MDLRKSDQNYFCTVKLNLRVPAGLYTPDWDPEGTDEQTIVLANLLSYIKRSLTSVDVQVQHMSVSDIWEGPSLVKRN